MGSNQAILCYCAAYVQFDGLEPGISRALLWHRCHKMSAVIDEQRAFHILKKAGNVAEPIVTTCVVKAPPPDELLEVNKINRVN